MAETVNQENQNGTGSETPKTFTQEQVDAMIKERVNREKQKFADYDSLKEKASKYDQAQDASKTEIQKLTEKITGLESQLTASKKNEEIRSVRDKVAKETGVPVHLLTGETEEACTEQATKIKEFASASVPEVRDGGEAGTRGNNTKTRDQFADWFGKQ